MAFFKNNHEYLEASVDIIIQARSLYSHSEDNRYAKSVIKQKIDFLKRKTKLTEQKNIPLSLDYLAKKFDLHPFEILCLIFAIAGEYLNLEDFTVDFAFELYEYFSDNPISHIEELFYISNSSKLNKYFVNFESEDPGLGKTSCNMKLKDSTWDFLFKGESPVPFFISDVYYPSEPLFPLLPDEKQIDGMEKYLNISRHKPVLFLLDGISGSGRRFIVKHLAKRLEFPVLFFDFERFYSQYSESLLYMAEREIILRGAVPCFIISDNLENAIPLFNSLSALCPLIFVISGEKLHHPLDIYEVFDIMEITTDRYVNHLSIWEYYLENCGVKTDISAAGMADRFFLPPGKIKNAISKAVNEMQQNNTDILESRLLISCCYSQSAEDFENLAELTETVFNWEDLVLPEDSKALLHEACDRIAYRPLVYKEWGFGRKLPYGGGLSLLFSGPPGTGKTMAAQIVAGELGFHMYKVNAAQISSKYVGETEKNLDILFSKAKRNSVILFFDEADALFGKRTEVKNSQDRYANMEASFLLQKMEEHDGVSILSTNFMQNIDEALIRRLHYVIKFPFPEPEYRILIWKSSFPEKVPIDNTVDFEYLARQFELSGSNIKAIALSSAFLAAKEKASVNMSHILKALRNDMSKRGKILLKEDLGEYFML